MPLLSLQGDASGMQRLLLLLLYELFGHALGLMERTGPEEEEEDFSLVLRVTVV